MPTLDEMREQVIQAWREVAQARQGDDFHEGGFLTASELLLSQFINVEDEYERLFPEEPVEVRNPEDEGPVFDPDDATTWPDDWPDDVFEQP
jgi:hypothetical protein